MPESNPQPAATQDRVIRVFISSTFRDMMRERDLLVKEVFPELRRKCAQRFVTFTEVDLRWGITEAQANEGQVLPLCLAEIERSRPYFIGLLGERYGWIPDTIRPEVIDRELWLKEHVQGRTSVTELEILHGVLNNPEMQSHAFFYFRDPAYVKDPALTDDERRDMVERDIRTDVEQYGPAEATRRTEERKAKLVALKQRIRDSKLPLVEPYANPKALAAIVHKQFDELIDRLYPEDKVPDPLAQERMAHEAHAKNKLFACIDRPAHLATLNAFAVGRVPPHGGLGDGNETPGEGTGPTMASQGLVLTGESGGGKTALLAAWARDWAKNHPEDFLFQHYFGATPDSASPEGFLRRLLGELRNRFGITDEIPTDPEKLRDALPVWLAQAAAKPLTRPSDDEQPTRSADCQSAVSRIGNPQSAPSNPTLPTTSQRNSRLPTCATPEAKSEGGRIILVLDGLNQVQGSEPDRHLLFLPRHFPPHVVALASALPGPALDALRERGWAEHDLPRASDAEVDAMVSEYLEIHARTLEPDLRHELVTAPGAKNPLFLRTVLEELRQFGSFERLPQRVRHYLEADNPKDLFMRVLTRWQEDFDGKDPKQDKPKLDLVRRALTHLWAARQGLSESEWLDLLGMHAAPSSLQPSAFSLQSSPFPRALWTPLFLALEPHLSQRAGLFAFGHDFLRHAAEAAFVTGAGVQQAAHLRLATYFETKGLTGRTLGEVPWQFQQAEDWGRLKDYIGKPGTVCEFYTSGTEHELLIYWRSLAGKYEMTSVYRASLAELKSSGVDADGMVNALHFVANLLERAACFEAAEELYREVLALNEKGFGSDSREAATDAGYLGFLLNRVGKYDQAELLCAQDLRVRERLFGSNHLEILLAVSRLGQVLLNRRNIVGAELLLRRAVAIGEACLGTQNREMVTHLMNLSALLHIKGDAAGALEFGNRALSVGQMALPPDDLSLAGYRSNLGVMLFEDGKFEKAAELLGQAVRTFEKVLGADHPETARTMNALALGLWQKGERDAAKLFLRRALSAREKALGQIHPDVADSLFWLGHVTLRMGDPKEAEPLLRRALLILETVFGVNHVATVSTMEGLAKCLFMQGKAGTAEPFCRRALQVREQTHGLAAPETLEDVLLLGQILLQKKDLVGARECMARIPRPQ